MKVKFVQISVAAGATPDANDVVYALSSNGEVWVHYIDFRGERHWSKITSPTTGASNEK